MPAKKLKTQLRAAKWEDNVASFLDEADVCMKIANSGLRIAIWSLQFEKADNGNPALPFMRGLQSAYQHTVALIALALYKPAGSAMRAMLESALFYTYFRTHPAELRTLATDEDYFIQKEEVLQFHQKHTLNFGNCEQAFGLVGKLKTWYKRISSIAHGQIPGTWVEAKAIEQVKHEEKTLTMVVDMLVECEEIIHQLFLCTTGRELWNDFSPEVKSKLCKGIPAVTRATLEIDRR